MSAMAASAMFNRWRDRHTQRVLLDRGQWVPLETIRMRRENDEKRPRGPVFSPREWIWIGITVVFLAGSAIWAFWPH